MNQHITTLAPRGPIPPTLITTLDEAMRLGDILARTGYFKEVRDAGQAVAKILYGSELGIGPMAAMLGVHIIEGKPVPSATLMATLIKRSGRYNYRVTEWTDTACVIEFTEYGQPCGTASFTLAEAQRARVADKDVWKKYPKAMLFSRAIGQGARAFCADVFGGAPVYTAEELDAPVDVDSNGEVQLVLHRALPAPQPEDDADLDADAAYQATLPASAPVVAPAPPAAAARPNGLPGPLDAAPVPVYDQGPDWDERNRAGQEDKERASLLDQVRPARVSLGWTSKQAQDWLNGRLGESYETAPLGDLAAAVQTLVVMAPTAVPA